MIEMRSNAKYIALGAVVLSIGLWYSQRTMLGAAPTISYEQAQAQQATERISEFNNDPLLVAAKDKATSNPKDLNAQKEYAAAILNRLRNFENPPQSALLQAIALLQNILQLDPNDKETLISMAEISFSQQVFDKAAEYYERYLANYPSDSEARARLGSALTFTGESKRAVSELERAVRENPKSFSSNAYLSIAYSQAGEREKAIKMGETALGLAPSDEAFKKFG
jgi:tetratricopeptide (TPR) repeat protein